MTDKVYSYVFALKHDAGTIRQFLVEDDQHLWSHRRPGGIYLGSDPTCDVVIDDPAIERFHACLHASGDHRYLGVIAGQVRIGGDDYRAGERRRLGLDEIHLGSWQLEHEWQRTAGPIETLAFRTSLPAPLAEAEGRLRLRIESSDGTSEIVEIGGIERLTSGIEIGADQRCHVRIAEAGDVRVRLVQKQQPWLEVLAGVAHFESRHHHQSQPLPVGEHALLDRWQRIRIGKAIVQLCRWPGRDERLRQNAAVAAAGSAQDDPRRYLDALAACIERQPPRTERPRGLARAYHDGFRFSDELHRLFTAWAERRVGTLVIDDLILGDDLLGTRLPTFVKGELYGEVDADYQTPRLDVLVIGEIQGRGEYLALRVSGGEVRDELVEISIQDGTESVSGRTLGAEIGRAVERQHARGNTTILDPFLG